MDENKPKVTFKMNGLKMILKITCPRCQVVHEKPFEQLPPGSSIPCSCGLTIKISGDGLAGAQRALDDLKRTLDRFGK